MQMKLKIRQHKSILSNFLKNIKMSAKSYTNVYTVLPWYFVTSFERLVKETVKHQLRCYHDVVIFLLILIPSSIN